MLKKLILQTKIKFAKAIDNAITLSQILRLRNYIYKLRIISIQGGLDRSKDNLVIFIVYENHRIPKMTLDAINSFKRNGLQVFVVNNGNDKCNSSLMSAGADLVMTRNNTGKDFGGYKDATLYLVANNFTHWKKIIYGNDSVIYPRKSINNLINELLSSKYDYIAHSQVEEIHFHFQSFLFSCSNSLFNHNYFYEFWRSYIPIDRRRYMIKNGEVGLTKKIIKTGCSINTINTFKDYTDFLSNFSELNEFLNELPTRYRTQKLMGETQSSLVNSILKYQVVKPGIISDATLIETCVDAALTKNASLKALSLNLLHEITTELRVGNPTHLGFAYFSKKDAPFVIKRDLSYRAGYGYDHILMIIRKYYPDEMEDISPMIKYPTGNHYKGIKATMFNNGMI